MPAHEDDLVASSQSASFAILSTPGRSADEAAASAPQHDAAEQQAELVQQPAGFGM